MLADVAPVVDDPDAIVVADDGRRAVVDVGGKTVTMADMESAHREWMGTANH